MNIELNVSIVKNTPKGKFGRIKHDYEVIGTSRPQKNLGDTQLQIQGLPEVHKLRNSKFMPLNEEWQFFLYEMMLRVCWNTGMPNNSETSAYVKNAFRSFLRDNAAFSNGRGSDTRADYVNGTNLDQPPIETETILTGGAYVESADGWEKHDVRGVICYAIRTLDGKKSPPIIFFDPWTQTPTVFFATISRRENLVNGKYTKHDVVTPFGQLGGRNCPMFLMGDGDVNYMPVEYVEILPVGALVPNSYNPPINSNP